MKILLVFFLTILFPLAANSKTLDEVKDRGFLICGVSNGIIGFSNVNSKGDWVGFDVDICRAVAAAIFSDADKVEFITTTNRSRFPILASGEIDILVRNTTWTFSRDTNLGFEFAGISFFDGQGFMVNKSLNVKNANELNGSNICVQIGTSKEFNLNKFFSLNNIKYNTIPTETTESAIQYYINGKCDVYSDLISELAIIRSKISAPSEHTILQDIISKEPLGPLVRHGDNEWGDLIRWCLYTMINAEELGLTSENINNYLESNNHEILRLLGVIGNYGDMLELDDKWAYNIIKQVGDYGSVFNRNIGPDTVLGLDRNINSLWSQNGLLFAPPFK